MDLPAILSSKKRKAEMIYSFGYFSPSSDHGRQNLQCLINRMADLCPAFVHVATEDNSIALKMAKETVLVSGVNVVMNVKLNRLGNTGLDSLRGESTLFVLREEFVRLLEEAMAAGICNLLLEYFDPDSGTTSDVSSDRIRCMEDAVKVIRDTFGNYFTIIISAVLEGEKASALRPDVTRKESRDRCVSMIKKCVDSGANYCLTDLFFDASIFHRFLEDLKVAGVSPSFPVIPGIMVIQSIKLFRKVIGHLETSVPERLLNDLNEIEKHSSTNENRAVHEYGLKYAKEMCSELIRSGAAHGVHFYTLNLEFGVRTCLEKILETIPKASLPWRTSAMPERAKEDVRPIFWAKRPRSYLLRTAGWERFPSGRWRGTDADCFAELEANPSLFAKKAFFERVDLKKKAWGEAPITRQEIFDVFAGFIEGTVPFLPWCEESLYQETDLIRQKLVEMNHAGFLTINSQPQVNAAPSDDAQVGWGTTGGYVYQKAYIEFFTSPHKLSRLIQLLKTPEFSSQRKYTYHAVDQQGNSYSNSKDSGPCAVTWGVFPGKEVIQPLVVDPATFMVWKDEAFSLWIRGWASLYEEHSPSADVIYSIHDEYFLVNIVCHDFINGDIFEIFDRVMSK